MIVVGFAALIALVVINAFFVAAEFAIVSVDPNRLHEAAESGNRRAAVSESLHASLSRSLTGVQLGITICSLALGVLSEPVVARLFEPLLKGALGERAALGISVVLAISLTAVAQMVAGEIVPKSIAVARPLETALTTARPFSWFMALFKPVISFSNTLSHRIVRLIGIEPVEVLSSVRSREELRRLLDTSVESGAIDPEDAELLTRTFAFVNKTAADALTPRTAVMALPATATLGELVELSRSSGFSRFPVIGEDLDEILGVVHVKDVLGIPARERTEHPLGALVRNVAVIPESKPLEPLMSDLQQADGQFAVVVDEYGGTAGIITLEDLVEEIVGDINDEHDPRDLAPDVRRWRGAHLLSGRLHPDEVEAACGLSIPRGDYETLAGFVLQRLGSIPGEGASFVFDGWEVTVTQMDGHRVAMLKVVAPSPGTVDVP